MKYTEEKPKEDVIIEVNDEESKSQASLKKRNKKVEAKKGIATYNQQ